MTNRQTEIFIQYSNVYALKVIVIIDGNKDHVLRFKPVYIVELTSSIGIIMLK